MSALLFFFFFSSPVRGLVTTNTYASHAPSRGGDVTVYVKRHKPTELAHSLYSVLVSVFVFMALSTVFHSINSPDNSPFSHSVLVVLALPYWSFQLYISL